MFSCVWYRNKSVMVGLLAVLLNGCATNTNQSPPQAEAEPQEPAVATTAEVAKPLPPTPEIIDTFIQHPHTIFQLTSQTYSMYVGGELTAEFDAQKNLLNIVADDNSVTCQYSKAGDLTPPGAEAKEEELKQHETACTTLITTLYAALSS